VAPLLRLTRGTVVITALPAVVNLELYRGDDFTLRIDVTDADGAPLDLATAVATAQVRTEPDAGEVSGELVPSIDGSAVYLHLLSATSAALPLRGVWDCQIVRGGRTTTLAGGTVNLVPDVTRP
jgi:hypothetical protein